VKNTGPAAPRLGTPLVMVPVNGVNVGKMQEGGNGGLLGALSSKKMGGRLGQHDADREGALVLGQGLNNDGDCWL